MPPALADVQPERMAAPFLKWAGGKARVLPQLSRFFPDGFRRYHEPFLGGGAVFFALAGRRPGLHATLIDANPDLMTCYRVVRDHLPALLPLLRAHQVRHAPDYYQEVRAQDGLDDVAAAARLLYLNKTCYNGLYRVNGKGRFNVPMGSYASPTICDETVLAAASRALQDVDLRSGDFTMVLDTAAAGDFLYFDPPFVPLSKTASFTSYWVDREGKAGFGWPEQIRLAAVFRELDARGCALVLSNSDSPAVHDLYAGYMIDRVQAPRMINSRADRRGPVAELVVRNTPE